MRDTATETDRCTPETVEAVETVPVVVQVVVARAGRTGVFLVEPDEWATHTHLEPLRQEVVRALDARKSDTETAMLSVSSDTVAGRAVAMHAAQARSMWVEPVCVEVVVIYS